MFGILKWIHPHFEACPWPHFWRWAVERTWETNPIGTPTQHLSCRWSNVYTIHGYGQLCGWRSPMRNSNLVSCWIGSWKNERKALVIPSKVSYVPFCSFTYHLAASLVRVHWKRWSQTKSSIMLFEENQRWKGMTWLVGSSPAWPLNLGMFEDSLVGMVGQAKSWAMGSLTNLLKSSKLRLAIYGRQGGGGGAWSIITMCGQMKFGVVGD